MRNTYRIGQGLDAHRLRRGRKLVLGGIEIPHHSGLLGHSDADVVLHALMNAILGAVGKDDIGVHFPDTDPHYRGIASAALLVQVLAIMRRCGFAIVNVDVTVLAQEPRLAPFFLPMRENIARLTKIAAAQVNIKAATTEALGWIGQSRGMMATAVVLLAKNPRARRRNS